MDQLTIFDVMSQFDENLANWTDVLGHFETCVILAYIPKDALSPLEQWTLRWDDPERKRKEKIWRDYCTAIWHQIGNVDDSWEKACRKLQKYRDEGKPCEMELSRSHRFMRMNDFRPDHVVEYL